MANLQISPSFSPSGGTITGNVSQTGASTLSTGTGAVSLNGDTTVASAKTLAVTTADKLTVGGLIVPQFIYLSVPIFATDVSKSVFVATDAVQVVAIRVVYGVLAVAGTLNLEKLTGTQAPAGGTTMLTGDIALTGTANTVLSGTLTSTTADLQLAAGNRIGIPLATLTGLVGCTVTIVLKRI